MEDDGGDGGGTIHIDTTPRRLMRAQTVRIQFRIRMQPSQGRIWKGRSVVSGVS